MLHTNVVPIKNTTFHVVQEDLLFFIFISVCAIQYVIKLNLKNMFSLLSRVCFRPKVNETVHDMYQKQYFLYYTLYLRISTLLTKMRHRHNRL